MQRHPVLYEVERWRSWRPWLLFPATISVLVILFTTLLRRAPASSLTGYGAVALFASATALAMYVRQRAVYLEVEGEALVVHALATRVAIPLAEVRRVRVTALGRALRGALPRPARRWEDAEAIVVRAQDDSVDLRRVRRALGPRCVVDGELVVPVAGARQLVAEIGRLRPEPPVRTARARPRGRR